MGLNLKCKKSHLNVFFVVQLVTKNQNTKYRVFFNICCRRNLKREEARMPLLSLNCDNNKNKEMCFVFGFWILVTG